MMTRFFQRFARDRRANIVPMFGIALIPVVGLIGAAVDYARANKVKAAQQSALDATVLAMSSQGSTLNAADMQTAAQAYFNAIFTASGLLKNPSFSVTYTNVSGVGPQLSATSNGNVKTNFLSVLGINNIPVGSSSTSAWGLSRLRVALVLDNTGSMDDDGKMPALKTATKSLLKQLKDAVTTNGDVYVSIIPFSRDVNVGSSNYSASWIDWSDWEDANQSCSWSSGWGWGGGSWNCSPANHNTWNGCITDRGGSSSPSSSNYDQNVTAPGSSSSSKYPAEQFSGCPVAMKALSYNWTAMDTLVDSMTPNGSTNQPIGLVWGWLSLVGGGPFTSIPAMDVTYQYTQVIILLSDGLNTQDRWYGNGRDVSSSVDKRMYDSTNSGAGTCRNVKDAGIIIYAIQVNTGGDAQSSVMQNCASSSDKFFMLTQSNQIGTIFTQIGTKLSKLRVAK